MDDGTGTDITEHMSTSTLVADIPYYLDDAVFVIEISNINLTLIPVIAVQRPSCIFDDY